MVVAEVQFYDVMVFFHIAAVVLAFGPTFAYGVFFATAATSNPSALPTVARATQIWSTVAGRIGMLVILATGIYLADDRWDFGDFFISWGLGAILVLYALIEFFFIPTTRKFIDAAENGRAEEAQAIADRQRIAGPIAGILVLVTIYVMAAKPFL